MNQKCDLNLDDVGLVAMAKLNSEFSGNSDQATAWLTATVEGLIGNPIVNDCDTAKVLFNDRVPELVRKVLQRELSP